MKHQSTKVLTLSPGLKSVLDELRRAKGFDAKDYIRAKVNYLNAYFKKFGIKQVLVAVSGGIDSACVFKLLKQCNVKVHGYTIPASPINGINGVTGQQEAADDAQLVDPEIKVLPLMDSMALTNLPGKLTEWSVGQAIPYLRTATLYSMTASLTEESGLTILVGTTNRDEGAYLGYFGKASDGLVDIQVISDLHKSEVYAVSRALDVPAEILNRTPVGDMYDGRTDEQVFGATYDAVELALIIKQDQEYPYSTRASEMIQQEDNGRFLEICNAVEALHKYNHHKYIASSPAIHLDLEYFGIHGGWRTNMQPSPEQRYSLPNNTRIDELDKAQKALKNIKPIYVASHGVAGGSVIEIRDVLDEKVIEDLMTNANQHTWFSTNENGYEVKEGRAVSSFRQRIFAHRFTAGLFAKTRCALMAALPRIKFADLGGNGTEHAWTVSGFNPMLRFISYADHATLQPHYDSTWTSSLCSYYERSFMTIVIFLTDGTTTFMKNIHGTEPVEGADIPLEDAEVVKRISVKAGTMLLFKPTILHMSEVHGGAKRIIRTELMYTRPNFGNLEL